MFRLHVITSLAYVKEMNKRLLNFLFHAVFY